MKLHSLTPALLALAGVLFTQSAQAAFAPSGQASSGDLILAFAASSGTGSTLNYEVDLGSVSAFQGTPSFSSINLNTDLTSIYGAGWFNDTNLSFAIVGTVNNGAAFGYKNGSVLASTTTSIPAESKNSLSGSVSGINALYNPASGTAGSAANSLSILTSDGSSFTGSTSGNGTYGFLGSINGSFAGSGTTPIALSLDVLQPGTGGTGIGTSTALGSFALASDGTLSFSVQSVPEPSTYALMFGGLVLLWQVGRRKFAHIA